MLRGKRVWLDPFGPPDENLWFCRIWFDWKGIEMVSTDKESNWKWIAVWSDIRPPHKILDWYCDLTMFYYCCCCIALVIFVYTIWKLMCGKSTISHVRIGFGRNVSLKIQFGQHNTCITLASLKGEVKTWNRWICRLEIASAIKSTGMELFSTISIDGMRCIWNRMIRLLLDGENGSYELKWVIKWPKIWSFCWKLLCIKYEFSSFIIKLNAKYSVLDVETWNIQNQFNMSKPFSCFGNCYHSAL